METAHQKERSRERERESERRRPDSKEDFLYILRGTYTANS